MSSNARPTPKPSPFEMSLIAALSRGDMELPSIPEHVSDSWPESKVEVTEHRVFASFEDSFYRVSVKLNGVAEDLHLCFLFKRNMRSARTS